MTVLTYKNACIMYLEQNMECVGYRDYIIKQLNKLEQIEQIMTKYQDTLDNFYSGKPRDLLESDVLKDIKEVLEQG